MRSVRPNRHVPAPRRPQYRPHLHALEERLPLGDGVVGAVVGLALLGHAAPAAEVPAVLSAPDPSGPRAHVQGPSIQHQGHQTPAGPAELFAAAFAEMPAALPQSDALPTAFASPVRRQQAVPSADLQREAVPGPQPSPALPAGEGGSALRMLAPAPLTPVPSSSGELLTTLAGMRPVAAPAAAVTPAQEARVQESFGKLPLSFEGNVGQTDAAVHFFARGPGYGLYLTGTEAVMVLSPPEAAEAVGQDSDPAGQAWQDRNPAPQAVEAPPAVVRLQVLGGNPAPAVVGLEQQPGIVNYFLGNDSSKWRTNIHTYARVEYDNVYPGIDLVYYGRQQQLEYDFVVAPGVDPSVIRLNVSGAERLELDAAGDLLIHAGEPGGGGEPGGVSPGITLRQHKPFVYQQTDGARQEVASRFVLEGQQVRFQVGAYDAGLPLVIDPVLSYSTYLGGRSDEGGSGIAVDPATGDALLTGSTSSTNFPTANPLQASNRGSDDVFVARLNAAGSALVFSTYLGGSSFDAGLALTVDPVTGDALLMGTTGSTNFPTANPLQASNRGSTDVFVARLSGSGSALVFSTYLGGSDQDHGEDIAVDPATGDALVTGHTYSTDFPTLNPLQATLRGETDTFVARLNAAGSALIYSTYLGGSDGEGGGAIAVDPASGDALVTGLTVSLNFPTANPLQATLRGTSDGFVARLNASGSALVFSTYLGGSDEDYGNGIAVDPASGDALVTGFTWSTNFPTANPLQASHGGGFADGFVARLSASGSALVFSTYLGGSDDDGGSGIAVDPASGDALVTGSTTSTNFPTANPLQPTCGGCPFYSDAFVARLNAAGSALIYSTYLGGSATDGGGNALAVDPATGDALVTGYTRSPNFPTANPFQPAHGGGQCGFPPVPCADAFVTRVGSSPVASFYVYPDSGTVTAGVPFDLYVFALDARSFVIPDYTGAIGVFTTDPLGTPMFVYQFRRTDRGVASFAAGLTLHTPGLQEVYVFDAATATVWGYAVFDVRP